MAETLVELRNVAVARGGVAVLAEASLLLREGEVAVVMGPAGSGKSSLLKAAAGILVPDSGEASYRGRAYDRFSAKEELEFRRRAGFAFQDGALWSNQSIFENLALPLRLHHRAVSKGEIERRIARLAELVGYGDSLQHRPAELSAGERKLVGLARALALDPELLFLDEPLALLDEESAERVVELLAGLKARGRAMLVASGSSELAARLADTLGVLRAGRIEAWGSYEEARAWRDPALRGVTGRLRARTADDGRGGGSAPAASEAAEPRSGEA